jgi:sec-independent protein translocase protein TatB
MFDVGFSEIVVIAVVALVVIGPEKLPKTARTLGVLFGRLQRYVGEVKADINREMELDELRKLQREMQSTAQDLKQSVETAAHSVESGVRGVESDLNALGSESTPAAATGVAASSPTEAADTRGNAGESPAAAPMLPIGEPPRQAPLPGFEKI